MSAVPERIGILMGRQGGFSSLILPGPLEVNARPSQWIYLPLALDEIEESGAIIPASLVTADSSITLTSEDGPFDTGLLAVMESSSATFKSGRVSSETRPGLPIYQSPAATGFTIESYGEVVLASSLQDSATFGTGVETSAGFTIGFSTTRTAPSSALPSPGVGVDSSHMHRWTVMAGLPMAAAKTWEIDNGLAAAWNPVLGVGIDPGLYGEVGTGRHHYALSVEGTTARFFIDGQSPASLGFSGPSNEWTVPAPSVTNSPYDFEYSLYRPFIASFTTRPTPNGRKVKCAFSRFTHAALYTGPFTPPVP